VPFGDGQTTGPQDPGVRERPQRAFDPPLTIRGVQQSQIEDLAGAPQVIQHSQDVSSAYITARRQTRAIERPAEFTAQREVALDEHGPLRAPVEGFDAQRPGPREEIEHYGIFHHVG
jgi:hypothetical protein